MSPEEQARFAELLEFDDVEILAWVHGETTVPSRFRELMQKVREVV